MRTGVVVKELLGFLNLRDQRLLRHVEERFQEFLKERSVATRADIDKLDEKIEELNAKISQLS